MLALFASTHAASSEQGPKFYGRANVSYEYVNENSASFLALQSNYSKIGVKGCIALKKPLCALYHLDYQVDYDGADTFHQLNAYVGIKGVYGTALAGYIDTPLRKVQKKVDLFNFMRGDINKVITVNENRRANSLQYIAPSTHGFVAYVAYILQEDTPQLKPGTSASVTFTKNGFYAGVAYDQNVEQPNAKTLRFVTQYSSGPLQLGMLLESYQPNDAVAKIEDPTQSADQSYNGVMVSIKYQFNPVWVGRAQWGESDIVYDNGATTSVGLDYVLSRNFRFYGFYTQDSASRDALDRNFTAIGMAWGF